MSVYYDKAKERWRYSFNRVIGRRRVRATKLLPAGWSRAQAEAYDRSEGSRHYAEATGLAPRTLTLAGAVRLYLDHRLPDLRDQKNIARELAHLLPELQTYALQDAADAARKYAAKHVDELAPATIRNRLSYLRAAIRYAWRRHNYGDRNHAEQIQMPTVRNERQVYLKIDQVRELLLAIKDPEARAVFTLAFWTGLRWIKEVLPRQQADVLKLGRETWLLAGITKNGSPRMKPVRNEARWALKHLPFKHHWRTYYAEFEAARLAMDLPHVHAHDLRHSLASDVISGGGTLDDVRAVLDHDSVVSARRYAHLYPERLRQVFAKVGQAKTRKKPVASVQKNAHRRKSTQAQKVA